MPNLRWIGVKRRGEILRRQDRFGREFTSTRWSRRVNRWRQTMRNGAFKRSALLGMSIMLASGAGAWAQDKPKGQDRSPSARIAHEVRHELVMLPYYGVFDNLAFRLEGDTVTLLGQVTRPTLKSDAEGAVKQIEGVRTVKNEIEVLPLSPDDDRIR